MKRTLIAGTVAALLSGLGLATAEAWKLPAWLRSETPQVSARAASSGPAASAASPAMRSEALPPATLPNFRAIVQSQGPAVVGVTVSGLRKVAGRDGPAADDDPFFRFFRGLPGFPMPPQGPAPFRGQGSGFIVSADGLVLTNAHVVQDARQVSVKLGDRREFAARVLGSDPGTDVAVLKIDAQGLPTVALGDPQGVQVGDFVLAIGAPYGFEQTATQGIVSAKRRSLPGDGVVPFIQTDAAVNPGNSGGPLFDAAGRAIGINAQIWSQSGGFQGLAFAIPIDVALKVKDQIVAHGRVEHARLGVALQDLSAPLAASFGLKNPDGAVVSSVAPGSAAERAGLRAGDVITSLDGAKVQVAGDVSSRIGLARPGERLTLGVWRERAARELKVTLGRADAGPGEAAAQAEGETLGLAVRPLGRTELASAGLDHGLLIEQVTGPAQWAGIQPGDVLLALNGRPVKDVGQVREVLRSHPKQVALLVARDGQQIFVPVSLG